MFRRIFVAAACLSASMIWAQEPTPPKPQVKVNMLNVCTPSAEEQQEISEALSRIPKRPAFSPDFEVDRGRSVLDQNANPLASANGVQTLPADSTTADFVRMRRDLAGTGVFSNVQYSFSHDSEQMVETLVFRVRDPKDLLQVSIEDSASSVTTPSAMLGSRTPASRIRLERFGKSSVVLARCSAAEGPVPDQSKYEPLFASASSVLSDYRELFAVRTLVPEELARIAHTGSSAHQQTKKGATHK